MNARPVDAEILRRHFVAIATCEYDDTGLKPLPGAVDEVAALSKWLCDETLGARRFAVQYPQLARNPTKQQIRDALEDPEPTRRWRRTDAAVLFVSGHGIDNGNAHFIMLKDSDTSRPLATAVKTADVVGWLTETKIDHLLVIMDMCYAGQAAIDTVRLSVQFPDTWLVLATATKEPARTGVLTSAVRQFLDKLNSPDGTGQQFNHGPYLRVDDFLGEIQVSLKAASQRLAILQQGLPDLKGTSFCLPNPLYRAEDDVPVTASRRDLALLAADLDAHWGPRARGVTDTSDPGWLFTGRVQLMRHLIQATTGKPGTLLVTGRAGSGKSAALARLVTLSDPGFVDRYAQRVEAISDDLKPAIGAVDVAVLATGKTAAEVMAQICRALGALPAGGSAPNLEDGKNAWRQWIQARDEPVTIVLDALDEASHPGEVLTGVLQELQPSDPAERRVRLLVGVRSPGGTGQPSAAGATAAKQRPLADLAEGVLTPAERLRVDEAPWWNRGDVVDYVVSLLLAPAGSPYRTGNSTGAKVIGEVLADAAGTSYLVARIAAAALAQRTEVIDPDDPGWRTAINDGVLGVFRDDLHKTLPDPDDRERAVHLLRAVAFAYGRGLPWRTIWPLVANAVADDPARYQAGEARSYGDYDIAWLLGNRIGAYLVTDQEDDITVYRLFHDDLRTTLRERWLDLLEEPAT